MIAYHCWLLSFLTLAEHFYRYESLGYISFEILSRRLLHKCLAKVFCCDFSNSKWKLWCYDAFFLPHLITIQQRFGRSGVLWKVNAKSSRSLCFHFRALVRTQTREKLLNVKSALQDLFEPETFWLEEQRFFSNTIVVLGGEGPEIARGIPSVILLPLPCSLWQRWWRISTVRSLDSRFSLFRRFVLSPEGFISCDFHETARQWSISCLVSLWNLAQGKAWETLSINAVLPVSMLTLGASRGPVPNKFFSAALLLWKTNAEWR